MPLYYSRGSLASIAPRVHLALLLVSFINAKANLLLNIRRAPCQILSYNSADGVIGSPGLSKYHSKGFKGESYILFRSHGQMNQLYLKDEQSQPTDTESLLSQGNFQR